MQVLHRRMNLKRKRSEEMRSRYVATSYAGSRDGKRYAVLDRLDLQGGRGMRRVSFHKTWKQAQNEAKRLNNQEEE